MSVTGTILIVDDSISIRKQVRAILEKAGYRVREAGNRVGMLNMLEEYGVRVSLVMMDLTLNSEHGFDLIRVLRETPGYEQTPVIVVTEHSDRSTVVMARVLGIMHYLVKPIRPDLLLERCRQAINH